MTMPSHEHILLEKTLSANDCGLTGAHQAGILIPKNKDFLDFFPILDPKDKNPRKQLLFYDETGHEWIFNYIYYNNRLRGGTRNEYRLTCMTEYIKNENLEVGDKILLQKKEDGVYKIKNKRYKQYIEETNSGEVIISLSGNWKIVNIK